MIHELDERSLAVIGGDRVSEPSVAYGDPTTEADVRWALAERLPAEALTELAQEVAGLPSELEAEAEEAKRFDLLILNL